MLTEILVQSVLFAAAVFLVFYVPGSLLFSISRIAVDGGLNRSVMRLGIGLVVVPILYRIARRVEAPDLLLLTAILAIAGYWLYRAWRAPRGKWTAEDTLPLLLGILWVGALLSFSHFADLRVTDDGTVYRTTLLSESTFHQGLVNALRDGYPPPAIYAAGATDFSHYHLNMHLQMEGVHRLTGIATERLVYWYFPFLYFLLLFLLPFGFVRNRGGGQFAAAAAGIMVFGAGLSFLPGILGLAEPSFAWIQFFHPTVFSIFTLNGLLPALMALFIVLNSMPQASREQSVGFWLVLGLVIFGSYGLKSSMGLQIAGVLLAVGIFKYAFDRPGERDWKMAACGALTLAVMLIDQELIRTGMGKVFVELRPWFSLNSMLSRLGLEEVGNFAKPAWFALFFLLTLGVRIPGLLTVSRSVRSAPETRWLAVFVLLFLLGGYVAPEIIYLGDSAYWFNHAAWFAIQGLFASWYLLFLLLARMDVARSTSRVAVALLVILALPSTLQLLWLKTDSPEVLIGPYEQEVVEFLETTEPGAVVMHPLNQGRPSLASNLAGRSSVLNVHLSFVNETEGLEQRVAATVAFFDPKTDAATRTAIMNYYGVTHVYGPQSFDSSLERSSNLMRVLRNDYYSLWELRF